MRTNRRAKDAHEWIKLWSMWEPHAQSVIRSASIRFETRQWHRDDAKVGGAGHGGNFAPAGRDEGPVDL